MGKKIADTGVAAKSERLAGCHLLFGVCGSIGAVDSVRQIRELRRHGARITPVLSKNGARLITPLSLEWASQEKVIQELSAASEHLGNYHGLILCPATWNTLVKLSLGIADTTLLNLATIQIARQNPVVIVPTLNEEFTQHPRFSEVVNTLEGFPGVSFFWSPVEEGRLKMPDPENLASVVCTKVIKSVPSEQPSLR